MKKFLVFLLVSGVVIGGPLYYYYVNYNTTDYYTQINKGGKRTYDTEDGNPDARHYKYEYQLESFNDKGEKRVESFNTVEDKPLKENAYLKLKINKKKGVMGWEEVTKDALPKTIEEKFSK